MLLNMCHRSGEKMDIYYSIVMLLIVCGVLHLALLGFTRYYIRKWFWVVELVWEALLGYLNLVPVCLTWLVWKECDSGIYQNTKQTKTELGFCFSIPCLLGLMRGVLHIVILLYFKLFLKFNP